METTTDTHPLQSRGRVNSRLLQASANIQAVHKPVDDAKAPSPPHKRNAVCYVNQKDDMDLTHLVRVSKTHLHAVYGGTMGFYTIALAVPCESTVVIHLLVQNDRTRSVRLSTSRLCFTPTSYGIPQAVGVHAVDVTRDDILIVHRVFSQDERFDQLEMPQVHVAVYGNEAAYVWSFGGDAILQEISYNKFARREPLLIPGMKEQLPDGQFRDVHFSSLASGENFTVVVSSQSCLAYSFGQGTEGEMGNHTCFSTKTPVLIQSSIFATPQERPAIVALSCGKHHVAISTRAGQMFTWGSGRLGQLGHCNYLDLNAPKLIQFDKQEPYILEGTVVTSVACGGFHTLAITDVQHVLAFGHNKAGQLGFGHRASRLDHGWRSCVPSRIDSLSSYSIHQVAAGVHHSACISTQGDLFTWGCGVDGRLGQNSTSTYNVPTLVDAVKLLGIVPKLVRCGGRHTALISDADLLYTWGANDFGQLGVGDTRTRLTPTIVDFPFRSPIMEVSLGHFHSAAINGLGELWTWGYDINGGLGMEIDGAINLNPTLVKSLAGFGAVQVQCGWSHTTVLTKRNHPLRRNVMAAGSNQEETQRTPRPMTPEKNKRARPQSAHPQSSSQAKPTPPDATTPHQMSLDSFRKRMERIRPQSAHPSSRKSTQTTEKRQENDTKPTKVHSFLRKRQPKQQRPQTARTPRSSDITPKLVNPKRRHTREVARQFVAGIIQQVLHKLALRSRQRQRPRTALHQRIFTRQTPTFPSTTPRKAVPVPPAVEPPVPTEIQPEVLSPASTDLMSLLSDSTSWASTCKQPKPPPTRPKSAIPRSVPLALALEMEREKTRTWQGNTMESVLKEKQRHRIWLR